MADCQDLWLACHWPLFVSPATRYGQTSNSGLPIPVTNLERRCRAAAVVADCQAYVGRVRTADAHAVHVKYKIELRAAAVFSLQVEVDCQSVDRTVKDKVHVSAHLFE